MSYTRKFSEIVFIDYVNEDAYITFNELEEAQRRIVLLCLALDIDIDFDPRTWSLKTFMENITLDTCHIYSLMKRELKDISDEEPPWDTEEKIEL